MTVAGDVCYDVVASGRVGEEFAVSVGVVPGVEPLESRWAGERFAGVVGGSLAGYLGEVDAGFAEVGVMVDVARALLAGVHGGVLASDDAGVGLLDGL